MKCFINQFRALLKDSKDDKDDFSTGVIYWNFSVSVRTRAAAFWISWNHPDWLDNPAKKALQSSKTHSSESVWNVRIKTEISVKNNVRVSDLLTCFRDNETGMNFLSASDYLDQQEFQFTLHSVLNTSKEISSIRFSSLRTEVRSSYMIRAWHGSIISSCFSAISTFRKYHIKRVAFCVSETDDMLFKITRN